MAAQASRRTQVRLVMSKAEADALHDVLRGLLTEDEMQGARSWLFGPSSGNNHELVDTVARALREVCD